MRPLTGAPIRIRRETDASLINALANAPDVAPFVNYSTKPIDFAPALAPNCGVIFLSNGRDAVAAFERTAPRRWQSHTLFGPTCRGRAAIDTGRAMVAWMLDRCADVLWGATALKNRKARWFNHQIGAVVVGHADYEIEGPVGIFEIRRAA